MAVTTKKKKAQSARRKSSSKGISNTPVYNNAHAHLLDELRWLNRLLAAHVLRLRRVNFYDGIKDFRGFFIADEEIDALLAAGVFEENAAMEKDERNEPQNHILIQAQEIRATIARRVEKSIAHNIFLPLVQLQNCFHLGEFERQALVICMAPQIDVRYEKLYSYLQNDISKKSPSVDLIISLLTQNLEEGLWFLEYFQPTANLQHYRLVESLEIESTTLSVNHFLRADPRLVSYILGHNTVDKRLLPYLTTTSPILWEEIVVDKQFQNRLQKLFRQGTSEISSERPVFYFYGKAGVGKKTLARALCGDLGVNMAVVDLPTLLQKPDIFRENIRLLLREGLLQPCVVYFDHFEALEKANEDNPALIRWLIQEVQELGWITFAGSENSLPSTLLDLLDIYPVEIPRPDFTAQKALWESYLESLLADSKLPKIEPIIARFDLTSGQIAHAVRLARQSAIVRDPQNGKLTLDNFMASSRVQAQPKLSALAHKIEPKFQWNDIVLPEGPMRQLYELVNQVKYKHIVMGNWGFTSKLSLGQGTNALFTGPSGTGKTMAAEVIANDLSLDLYKIDLSSVVSKYIGETEKNLNRVFSEAQHSNAILFFDEADALFGKRSEVKDAHDRYANIEIAFLLQKMEEYEGITILATNLRQNIDDAFTRRIRFIVEFPFPEEVSRLHIWQGIFPEQTPLAAEVDLDFMARQFKLSGGNIRNVALTAAFYAADNGRAVKMGHLMLATKREFQKMGKICDKAEFGKYFELL